MAPHRVHHSTKEAGDVEMSDATGSDGGKKIGQASHARAASPEAVPVGLPAKKARLEPAAHHEDAQDDQEDVKMAGDEQGAVPEAKEVAEREPAPLESFVSMPTDILAQICLHLRPPAILQLARTAKLFRSFLLSRSARPIWIASRINAGFPPLKHIQMSDIQYLVMVFGEPNCYACSKERSRRDEEMRIILCETCLDQHLVRTHEALDKLPGLHPESIKCAPIVKMGWSRSQLYYSCSDLQSVSATLMQCQAEDEAEAREGLAISARTRRSTKRRSSKPQLKVVTRRVDAFIAQMENHWKQDGEERQAIKDALSQYYAEKWRIEREEEARRIAAEDARLLQQKTDLLQIGWSLQDWTRHRQHAFTFPVDHLKPPMENPDAWFAVRTALNNYLREADLQTANIERENALRTRRLARKVLVREKWMQMLNSVDFVDQLAFPRWKIFKALPSVALFWVPEPAETPKDIYAADRFPEWKNEWESPKLDQAAWSAQLPTIMSEVAAYQQKVDAYSVKITSFVLVETPATLSADQSLAGAGSAQSVQKVWSPLVSSAYKIYTKHIVAAGNGPEINIECQGARALLAVMKLARVTVETATFDDLDALGPLKWIEYSREVRLTVWDWRRLIIEVNSDPCRSTGKDLTIVRAELKKGKAVF